MEERKRERESVEPLWLEEDGPDGLVAVLNEEDGVGYFGLYRPENNEILVQVRLWVDGRATVRPEDVEILWSDDNHKCGVSICNLMYAIIDLRTLQHVVAPVHNCEDAGITESEWLDGFLTHLPTEEFIEARRTYWKCVSEEVANPSNAEDGCDLGSRFLVTQRGPGRLFAVFEDDGVTGYLYVYDAHAKAIQTHIHVYDSSQRLTVHGCEVAVLWADDGTKCGVAVFGKMRAIIDLRTGQEGRVWLESPDTPGIGDRRWLKGFTL